MGFASDARTVRDASMPREFRARAWGRCVRRYCPYGYAPTLRYLQERFGSLNDPVALESALSALERSRRAWLREVSSFAASRRLWKQQGRRRASTEELAQLHLWRWPGGEPAGGPPPGSAADRPVTHEFLARYGMTAWAPKPVNHRRRERRLPTVPGLFQDVAVTFGCGGSALALIALVVAYTTDPPWFFWTTFTNTGVTPLVVMAGRSIFTNDKRRRHLSLRSAHIVSAAAAAEQRWRLDRARSFNYTDMADAHDVVHRV